MLRHSALLAVAVGSLAIAGVFVSAEPQEKEEGYLGIFLGPVPEILAAHLSLAEGLGVVAVDVAAESPADKAGLKRYDVIVSLNGKEVAGQREFSDAIRQSGAESKVKLGVISKGQKKDMEVVLGALSEAVGKLEPGTGRRLLREGESPEDFFRQGPRTPMLPDIGQAPRIRPMPNRPDQMKPFFGPDMDEERWQMLEERMGRIEQQQAEILEKLEKLLSRE